MPLSVSLPQDQVNNPYLGLWDTTNARWALWRGRNGATTGPGSAAIADMAVVAGDAAGNAIVVTSGYVQSVLGAGSAAIGSVSVTSLPALVAGTATIGVVRQAQGNKAITTVAIGTTAAVVLAPNAARKSCLICNTGAATVYLGPNSSVTTTTGVPLASGDRLPDDASLDAWYGITASGSAALIVVEVS